MEQKNVPANAPVMQPVPFHGDTIYCVEYDGQPYAPVKPIIENLGLSWEPQARKLRGNNTRWGMINLIIPSAGGDQVTACMPVRKLPGFLATISPNKVDEGIRDKLLKYQNECDDVLWKYWSEGHAERKVDPPAGFEANLQGVLATCSPAQLAVISGLASRAQLAIEERDAQAARAEAAERTRGWIRDKQLASAMGTASAASKRAVKAEARAEAAEADSMAKDGLIAVERARADEWASRAESLQYRLDTNDGIVRAPDEFFLDEIPEVQEIFDLSINGAGSQIGKNLAAYAKAYGMPSRKPAQKRRGSKYLESLHRRGAIELWLASVRTNPTLLAKYRRIHSAA